MANIKLYPEVIFHAIRSNRPAGAFRLWYIAKGYNQGNSGFIPANILKGYVLSLGVNLKTYYRWLKQANTLGLITRVNSYYKLISWQDGAKIAGINNRIQRGVYVPLERFVTKGWLAWVWAGYILHFDAPTSRTTLEKLSGVPSRTQILYEHQAGVINQANYTNYGKPIDNPERAIDVIDRPGVYCMFGEIRERLPNSRHAPEGVSLANKGRLKMINRELVKEDGIPVIYRLYSQNAKQTKNILKRYGAMDVRTRPSFIYELSEVVSKKVGIYAAITV